jgi:hypothetical protein
MATAYGLLPGLTYWWRVRAFNPAGWGPYSAARKFAVAMTAVEEGGVPSEFALEQNYPNPFNPSTTIRYSLPLRARVTLTVFNSLGQQVELLRGEEQEAGYHEASFDATGLSSGVYFYRLTAGTTVLTRKMLLVR